LTLLEIRQLIQNEIATKYPAVEGEAVRSGETEILRIKFKGEHYDMVMHPMLEYKFVTLTKTMLESLSMWKASLEVQNDV
jgi:hypothetical protein